MAWTQNINLKSKAEVELMAESCADLVKVFLELRNGTCMRLDRRRIGTSEVVALTHFLHAEEWI